MNLLDRHIFRSVLFAAIAAVCLFAFVLMAGNILRDLMGPMMAGQIQLPTFLRLVALTIPYVLAYSLPLGILTGVLLTLGRLSADSEVTAMRAAGMSIPRIAAPILFLGVLCALVGLRVNFSSMPWAKIQYERELAAAIRANPLSFLRPKTFIREFPGYVVYVGSMNGADVRDFWLWQLDDQKRVLRFVRAESGRVEYDEASNEFIVTLEHARIEDHDRKAPDDYSQPPRIGTSEKIEPFRFSLARYFGTQTVHQKLQWMTYSELQAEKARVEAETYPPAEQKQHERRLLKVKMTIQDKFNLALATFSFSLVGIPLGIRVSRKETSANLGVAVALALAYYFLNVVVGWLDHHPEYHPELLIWLPNLAFLLIGMRLLRRVDLT